jgi:rubrerythrin
MSIVESLKKLVDPLRVREEQEQRRVLRERPTREDDGDPPIHVCRVCGLRAPEPRFCPQCLAETMRRE